MPVDVSKISETYISIGAGIGVAVGGGIAMFKVLMKRFGGNGNGKNQDREKDNKSSFITLHDFRAICENNQLIQKRQFTEVVENRMGKFEIVQREFMNRIDTFITLATKTIGVTEEFIRTYEGRFKSIETRVQEIEENKEN